MLSDFDAAAMIPVKDLSTTRRWYEDVLGLTPVVEDPGGITYKTGAGVINLYPTEFTGAKHTLVGWNVPNIEATIDELTAKGVTFEQYDLGELKTDAKGIADFGEGGKGAWFKDPEGNILSLWEAKQR